MIYFVCGEKSKEFEIIKLIDNIKKENNDIKISVYDGLQKDLDSFYENIDFNSLFSTNEILLLKRAEKIKNFDEILTYISKRDTNNKIIIIDYEIMLKPKEKAIQKITKKNMKLLEKINAEIISIDNSDDLTIEYVEKSLNIDRKTSKKIIDLVGKDPLNLKNEVDKVKIYLNGENFDFDKVSNILTVDNDLKMYEYIDKIISKKIKKEDELFLDTLEYKNLIYLIYNELETLYKLTNLNLSKNYTTFKNEFSDFIEIFTNNYGKPHPYTIFKKQEYLKMYKKEELKRLMYRCWELETDIKSGGISQELANKVLIDEINR